MRVKKISSAFVALMLAVAVVTVLSGPAEAAGKKCRNIAHRAMYEGTEEQVRGVRENARWGFTEIDARITKDNKIVALHDVNMTRPSGGRSNAAVGSLTLRQIRRIKFVLGRRVETTRRLIRIAARERSPIMVTINSYKANKAQWDNGGLAALYAASRNHSRLSRVFFGGAGAEKKMRELFPKASIFHRYQPGERVLARALANKVDLVGVPVRNYSRRLVRKLRAAGIWTATNQLERKRHVRLAQRVGINLMQTDHSRRTVRSWCR